MQIDNSLRSAKKLAGGGGTQRIGYVDALKGFAILLVVVEHVANGLLKSGDYPEAGYFLWGVDNVIYGFHMHLFMIISGFVFSTAYISANDMIDKRRVLLRVFNHGVIYCIACLSFGIVKIIAGGGVVNDAVTWKDILLIPAKPIGPFWYLYTLCIFYLLFSISLFLKGNGYVYFAVLVFLSACSQLVNIPWFSIDKLAFYAPAFYLGVLHQRNVVSFSNHPYLVSATFALSVLLYITFWREPYIVSNLVHYRILVSILIGFGVSGATWCLFEKSSLGKSVFLQTIGRYSFEIYIFHVFFSAGFRALLAKIELTNGYIVFFMIVVSSTFLPILISFLTKKLGMHRMLFSPVYFFSQKSKKRLEREDHYHF